MERLRVYTGEVRKYFWLLPPLEGKRDEFLIDIRGSVLIVTDDSSSDKLLERVFTPSLFGSVIVVVFPDLEELKGDKKDAFEEICRQRDRLQAVVYATVKGDRRGKSRPWWEKSGVKPEMFSRKQAIERVSSYMRKFEKARGKKLPGVVEEFILDNLPEEPREFITLLENAFMTSEGDTELSSAIVGRIEENKLLEVNVFTALGEFIGGGKLKSLEQLFTFVSRHADSPVEMLKFMGALKWYATREMRKARSFRERKRAVGMARKISEAELAMKGISRLSHIDIVKNTLLELTNFVVGG